MEKDQNAEEDEVARKSSRQETFLHELKLCVLDVPMGKRKAAMFRKQCSKFGGETSASLVEATHIVFDVSVDKERLSQMLRAQNVTFAEVNSAKLVTSEWLTQCLQQKQVVETGAFELSLTADDLDSDEEQMEVSTTSAPTTAKEKVFILHLY